MKKSVENAISSISRLEDRAAEKKPSIKEALAVHSEQIAQAKKEAPTADRPRPANAER